MATALFRTEKAPVSLATSPRPRPQQARTTKTDFDILLTYKAIIRTPAGSARIGLGSLHRTATVRERLVGRCPVYTAAPSAALQVGRSTRQPLPYGRGSVLQAEVPQSVVRSH